MGFILFIISFIAGLITFQLGIIYRVIRLIFTFNWKEFNNDFKDIAISIDQTLNTVLKPILNNLLIKNSNRKEYNFGDMDETVSYVIGINYIYNNLTWFGKLMRKMLYSFEKDHVIKAVMSRKDWTYEKIMRIYYTYNGR